MRKYAYNYKPSQEEINNAWELLSLVGRTELTFTIYNQEQLEEELNKILSLICSMPDFNSKDSSVVASGFKNFFKLLPSAYYNANNPNNGNPLFDRIILRGDDTITLKANGFKKHFEKYDWEQITRLVEKYGEQWKADESRLSYQELDNGFAEYTIRFWWD